MSDPYEDLGNARSTGRRPKPTPPAKPCHPWVFKMQKDGQSRHDCSRCLSIKITTRHPDKPPTVKYISPTGTAVFGRSPPCA